MSEEVRTEEVKQNVNGGLATSVYPTRQRRSSNVRLSITIYGLETTFFFFNRIQNTLTLSSIQRDTSSFTKFFAHHLLVALCDLNFLHLKVELELLFASTTSFVVLSFDKSDKSSLINSNTNNKKMKMKMILVTLISNIIIVLSASGVNAQTETYVHHDSAASTFTRVTGLWCPGFEVLDNAQCAHVEQQDRILPGVLDCCVATPGCAGVFKSQGSAWSMFAKSGDWRDCSRVRENREGYQVLSLDSDINGIKQSSMRW